MDKARRKEIAIKLGHHGIFAAPETDLLRVLAGYRNRLVQFYHEISRDELYEICSQRLADLEVISEAFRRWLIANRDKLDDIF